MQAAWGTAWGTASYMPAGRYIQEFALAADRLKSYSCIEAWPSTCDNAVETSLLRAYHMHASRVSRTLDICSHATIQVLRYLCVLSFSVP